MQQLASSSSEPVELRPHPEAGDIDPDNVALDPNDNTVRPNKSPTLLPSTSPLCTLSPLLCSSHVRSQKNFTRVTIFTQCSRPGLVFFFTVFTSCIDPTLSSCHL